MDILDSYTLEQSVLGTIIINPSLMGEAVLSLSAEDFQIPDCKACWQAMNRLFREGNMVDIPLLLAALTGYPNAGQFLMDCMEAAPYAVNIPAHIKALKHQSMLARLRDLGQSLSVCIDLDEALELLAKGNNISIYRAARDRRNMSQMFQSFANRHSAKTVPEYLPWPMKPLNDGIKVAGGKFVVVGGYPSDGKTAFALQSAMVQAENGWKTAFYSFETDADTAEDRLLSHLAQISMEAIQDNLLTNDDWSRWAEASGKRAEFPFDIVTASEMTVDDIRADALAHRYQVIYVDYLQLISPGRRNSNFSRFDEVSEISRRLQQLAKTTGITVVALSQMSRPAADKKGNVPAPTMHNLRESGQIEQDADVIMLIYRRNQKDIRAPRFLDVAKNKEGRTGHWTLCFDGAHQSFSMSESQDPPEGMPPKKRTHYSTPVLGSEKGNGANDALPDDMDQLTMLPDDTEVPF